MYGGRDRNRQVERNQDETGEENQRKENRVKERGGNAKGLRDEIEREQEREWLPEIDTHDSGGCEDQNLWVG